jgi:hypothetical protein
MGTVLPFCGLTMAFQEVSGADGLGGVGAGVVVAGVVGADGVAGGVIGAVGGVVGGVVGVVGFVGGNAGEPATVPGGNVCIGFGEGRLPEVFVIVPNALPEGVLI